MLLRMGNKRAGIRVHSNIKSVLALYLLELYINYIFFLQDFTYKEGFNRIDVLLHTKNKRNSRQKRDLSNVKNVVCVPKL